MTFTVKPDDVVVIEGSNEREYLSHVVRVTKTQIVVEGATAGTVRRFSLEDGREIGGYSRWSRRRDCIVRLALPAAATEYMDRMRAERQRIAKQKEIRELFAFLGASAPQPWSTPEGWTVEIKLERLTEAQVCELAAAMKALDMTAKDHDRQLASER